MLFDVQTTHQVTEAAKNSNALLVPNQNQSKLLFPIIAAAVAAKKQKKRISMILLNMTLYIAYAYLTVFHFMFHFIIFFIKKN
jgi:hypothetical protein